MSEQGLALPIGGAAGRRLTGSRTTRWITTGILVLGVTITLFPFAWMILGSFKAIPESNQFPPTVIPETWDWANYREAWLGPPGTLGRYLVNTVVVAVLGTSGQIALCSLAAYAFAQLEFRGRDMLFGLVLATMMVPGEITLIPNFVTIRSVPLMGGNDITGSGGSGLYDTYAAMILRAIACRGRGHGARETAG